MSTQQNNIIPKDCAYGCNTRIYWSIADNAYFEVFTKKKHICKNRSLSNNTSTIINTKPTFYNKKPLYQKPKMSNSLELLTGLITEIQKKYEILSDIVIVDYNGKIHGSQQSRDPKTGLLGLLVYYEVPLGQRDEVKTKYQNLIRNQVILQQQRN